MKPATYTQAVIDSMNLDENSQRIEAGFFLVDINGETQCTEVDGPVTPENVRRWLEHICDGWIVEKSLDIVIERSSALFNNRIH